MTIQKRKPGRPKRAVWPEIGSRKYELSAKERKNFAAWLARTRPPEWGDEGNPPALTEQVPAGREQGASAMTISSEIGDAPNNTAASAPATSPHGSGDAATSPDVAQFGQSAPFGRGRSGVRISPSGPHSSDGPGIPVSDASMGHAGAALAMGGPGLPKNTA